MKKYRLKMLAAIAALGLVAAGTANAAGCMKGAVMVRQRFRLYPAEIRTSA